MNTTSNLNPQSDSVEEVGEAGAASLDGEATSEQTHESEVRAETTNGPGIAHDEANVVLEPGTSPGATPSHRVFVGPVVHSKTNLAALALLKALAAEGRRAIAQDRAVLARVSGFGDRELGFLWEMNGRRYLLWHAVDLDGTVPDILSKVSAINSQLSAESTDVDRHVEGRRRPAERKRSAHGLGLVSASDWQRGHGMRDPTVRQSIRPTSLKEPDVGSTTYDRQFQQST